MDKSTCSLPDCDRRTSKAGLCVTHYRYSLESGARGNPTECRWPECERGGSARSLCHKHYARAAKLKDFDQPWLKLARIERDKAAARACKWPHCDRTPKCRDLCAMHYGRAQTIRNMVDPWLHWENSGICEICGKSLPEERNRNNRLCSRTCRAKAWSRANPELSQAIKRDAARRRRARIAGVTVEKFTTRDVRMAHGDDCYLCGKHINYKLKFPHPKSPSLDHVTPISAGGAHSVENTAMAHMECNNRKNAGATSKVPAETLFAL